jgi:hypothetical protein
MLIIDNFLPKQIEEEIKNTLYGRNFPWYFLDDVTYAGGNQQRPAASHLFLEDSKINSEFFNGIKIIPEHASKISQISYKSIILARSFLQYPLSINSAELDSFHIDQLCDHTVFLYYVNDSDGDTIIIDKRFNGVDEENVTLSGNNIIKRIPPKQGRIVIFDGAHYHTAEQPKNNMRCVINFNVI